MYSSVIFLLLPGLDTYSLHLRCIVGYWLAMIGYVIAFSAVLAKMWRVYYIFHNPTPSKRTLKDRHLLSVMGILTLIVIMILSIGEAVPDTRHEPTLVVDGEKGSTKNEQDVIVNYCTYTCFSSHDAISYQALIMAYLFLLQVIGIFLAFQTRKVKVKILNEAKQVTAIIYVTSVCVVLIIMTTFALGAFINVHATLFCFSIAAASTAFLVLIFIPKMHSLYKDPEGKKVFRSSGLKAVPSLVPGGGGGGITTASGTVDSLRKDSLGINIALATLSNDPKATISILNARIVELEEELRQSRAENGGEKRGSLLSGFLSPKALPPVNENNIRRTEDSIEQLELSKKNSLSPPPPPAPPSSRASNGNAAASFTEDSIQ
ncbi:PREDICTED: gamma-aminobutyric acid type B receptor subunit 2-like [Amphimedon queenslandica]|uniref:G-protein coupled receptors family 3 profile domain-containing protein n=1 Tax=Amphimedon queenslandica TaxID=400682 RepID=A0AAN0IW15_AMPQE|nr:PREDICTED: gamma-aminobutyric acid type B receptor subunit 2-like [Amphimedon queenslandica]|eukprot:XP_019849005.1 PREDICTED: gamma-aminobutyric acid type B receptor subunit 2-like [Amphimedon queenslandica]